MNKREHILTIVAEEATEVGQRISKALRFGLKEIQPGQPHDNATRIALEMADLIGAYQMAVQANLLPALDLTDRGLTKLTIDKATKVQSFFGIGTTSGVLAVPLMGAEKETLATAAHAIMGRPVDVEVYLRPDSGPPPGGRLSPSKL